MPSEEQRVPRRHQEQSLHTEKHYTLIITPLSFKNEHNHVKKEKPNVRHSFRPLYVKVQPHQQNYDDIRAVSSTSVSGYPVPVTHTSLTLG